MIIVEQNKTYLVNFDNVEHISIAVDEEETEYAIVSVTKSRDEIILGVYETEERAKEVLNAIKEKYTEFAKISNASGDVRQVFTMPKVYEMPEN